MPTVSILTFSSTSEQIENALRLYLCQQAYLPSAFVDPKNKHGNVSLFVPIYVFEVSFEADWHASFGFDRQEHYTEYVTETYNNVRRTRPVTRTKTITDWRPAHGTARGSASFTAYAGDMLPAQAIELIENAHPTNTTVIDPSTLAVRVEPFVENANQVYTTQVSWRVDAYIDRDVRSYAQGNRQDNWRWHARTSYSSRELLFPIEGVEIKFDDKLYAFWIDGSDNGRIYHDKLPKDSDTMFKASLGFIPAMVMGLTMLVQLNNQGTSKGVIITSALLFCVTVGLGFVIKSDVESRSRRTLLAKASQLAQRE